MLSRCKEWLVGHPQGLHQSHQEAVLVAFRTQSQKEVDRLESSFDVTFRRLGQSRAKISIVHALEEKD